MTGTIVTWSASSHKGFRQVWLLGRSLLGAIVMASHALAVAPVPALAAHGGVPEVVVLRADYVQRLRQAGESVTFVDLRKNVEFQSGHLPGAISLPGPEIERRHREIPRKGWVVLYCDCSSQEMIAVFVFLRSK